MGTWTFFKFYFIFLFFLNQILNQVLHQNERFKNHILILIIGKITPSLYDPLVYWFTHKNYLITQSIYTIEKTLVLNLSTASSIA